MRISFDLSEDKELREAVKTLVREQVVSVIRETISAELQKIVEQKKHSFDAMADEKARWAVGFIESRIENTIKGVIYPSSGRNIITERADKAIKDAISESLIERLSRG